MTMLRRLETDSRSGSRKPPSISPKPERSEPVEDLTRFVYSEPTTP